MVTAKYTRRVACAIVLSVLAMACTGSQIPPASPTPTAPPPAPRPIVLDGPWSGIGTDSKGGTAISWLLTRNGSTVSGTVATEAADPDSGSCNSCHRNKTGTFTGTISGNTLSLSMFFAAGAKNDPTPECSTTLTANIANLDESRMTASYSGLDTCEGPFTNGSMTLEHRASATATSPRQAPRD